jgi:CheY-like chemotaxis protein
VEVESEPAPVVAASTAGIRLLLAEDNAVNQMVARKMLERDGFEVDVANDGAATLRALDTRRYDAVLIDLQMPDMDGFAATRRIREGSWAMNASDIPVIALTAHAMRGDRETCLAAGMNDYVTKPIKSEELNAAIQRQLSAASVGARPGS